MIKLEIPVELSEPRFVVPLEEGGHATEGPTQVVNDQKPSTSKDNYNAQNLYLSTLPPLLLEILLPPAYPSFIPPEIISLHATHGWLARKVVPLRQYLMDMWQAGDGVLYTWIECIRSGEFMESLELLQSEDGKDVVKYVHPSTSWSSSGLT